MLFQFKFEVAQSWRHSQFTLQIIPCSTKLGIKDLLNPSVLGDGTCRFSANLVLLLEYRVAYFNCFEIEYGDANGCFTT